MRRYVLRAAQLPELAARLSLPDEAHLMWVTKAMSRLAVEYADSIPDCDWTAIQPARHGIVVWEGGTGQECVGADGRAQIVRGVAWSDDAVVGMTFKALADPPERSAFPLYSRRNAPLSKETFERDLSQVCARAGIEEVTAHQLRATFITLALDAGVPLRDVMVAAGHSSRGSTHYYDTLWRSTRTTAPHRLNDYLRE